MALFRFTWPYSILQCATAIALCLLLAAQAGADPLRISITGNVHVNKTEPAYFFEQLLILALEKTRLTDGDYVLLHNVHNGGIARDRAMLIAGAGIDVMWASATKERELQMRVVPVDLLKNLNNYRVLLINKDSQQLFAKVKTLDELKKFSVGSGEHWTDGSIFRDNGFNVAVTSSYSGLFKMLAARRFNFISRGLHEIGYDTKEYKDLGLIQEQTILLKYDVPIRYAFFVNKNNLALGDRIERGLKIAQQDGSFDQLFYQMPSFKEGEELLKSSRRTLIEIKNTKAE
ncbi:hypothetical protein GCM10011613_10690 [Cellvibrio zantedeschiae]|uniref:Solute-binding protein family 3/N-terminal domain-containing protein n=1 Tax=Cellvibrio zantedeschiae TaxID=1237077 RepID=A0ABQ3AUM9_9GAMM|nr:transporter substrate-binding domain-containing protein [Cellvibrio zantedeschiae]GGY68339.1 hypothetical protein GCM10011613_10690 [Cellvibrio zantedeschiae]